MKNNSNGMWKITSDGEANFFGISTKENWLLRVQCNGEKSVAEQRNIAKLIESAPETLDALKYARKEMLDSGFKNSSLVIGKLNDAIAMASGLKIICEPFEVLNSLAGSISGEYKKDIIRLNESGCYCSEKIYDEAY